MSCRSFIAHPISLEDPAHVERSRSLAVVASVEEAVYNSLTRATTVRGVQGHTVAAISIEKLRAIVTPQR